jgi:predicted nucleic acid-binding protein
MNDNVFLDTNILVYAHTDFDTDKQLAAQRLIAENQTFVSTQVLQELANTLNRKFKHGWDDVSKVLSEVTTNNHLHINLESTVTNACRVAARYGFSFYDSMIISAAIESNCNTLYSEDMNDGQIIDGKVTIRNPFK